MDSLLHGIIIIITLLYTQANDVYNIYMRNLCVIAVVCNMRIRMCLKKYKKKSYCFLFIFYYHYYYRYYFNDPINIRIRSCNAPRARRVPICVYASSI